MKAIVHVAFAELWQSHSRQPLPAPVKKCQFWQDMDMSAEWANMRTGPPKFFPTSVLNAEEELI